MLDETKKLTESEVFTALLKASYQCSLYLHTQSCYDDCRYHFVGPETTPVYSIGNNFCEVARYMNSELETLKFYG